MEKHTFEIQQSVNRHHFVIGVLSYNRADLDKRRNKGEKLNIAIVGLLHLQNDITPELASNVIESIKLRGMLIASDAVKVTLADRIT